MAKNKEPKEEVELKEDQKKAVDLNETAKNVAEVTGDEFENFVDFLGSYLEINMEKFGAPTLIHHLDKITLLLKLRELKVPETQESPPKEK